MSLPPPAQSPLSMPPPSAGYGATGAAPSTASGPPPANTSAVIAFVLSLLGFVFTPVVDIAAVILGHHALSTIRRTGEAGAGLAKAALGIGYGLIGLGLLAAVFVASLLAGSVAS